MSARGILDAAYRAQIVPEHLKGKTQHKTLQARLSEDILYHRTSSLFYRTAPGIFFLNELICDSRIPEKYKEKFQARRRTRDLQKDAPLGVRRSFLRSWVNGNGARNVSTFFDDAEMCDSMRYLENYDDPDFAVVWTFSFVRRGAKALSYRIGRYRDDREAFANKRTIGFPGVVTASDRTLFSQNDYGASDNALAVLLLDLDLSSQSFDQGEVSRPETKFLLEAEGDDGVSVALLVLEWTCPVWFEPTTLRLSLNDPCWLDLTIAPNNSDDFEPWSRSTLRSIAGSDF
jgi:hypothetical protein